jgi:excisionase family DNA binding protein
VSTGDATRYLTLAEVARRTGRHHEQLRQWCASGRLPCERFGRDWLLLESNLARVDRQPARRRKDAGRTGRVVGVSFIDSAAGREALNQAREAFGLGERALAAAPLAIDDVTLSLVAVIVPDERVDEAIGLFEGHGGRIVANIPEGGRPGLEDGSA